MPTDVHQSRLAGAIYALHCRGDVRIYRAGQDCTPKSKKGRALLAVLAAEQRPLTRVKIIDLLWSDRQEEQARASLRTLIADLKGHFGAEFDTILIVDRERVGLGPGVRTDLTDPQLARPYGELFEGLDHIDPVLDEWLRIERDKWAEGRAAGSQTLPLKDCNGRRTSTFARTLVALIASVLVAAAGFLYWRPWHSDRVPTIAVMPFADLTGNHPFAAEGIAEEFRLALAQNPDLEVIGRESSEATRRDSFGSDLFRRLGATHLVEGSIQSIGQELRLNVRLVDAVSGRVVWKGGAQARGADVAAHTYNLATDITEILTDVISNRAPVSTFKADDHAYAAVFAARAALISSGPEKAAEQRAILDEVVRRNPTFVPGLVVMSRATMSASDHPFFRGPIPLAQARAEASRYARRAIELAPQYAPAYDALAGAYRDMPDAIPLLNKALALSPGSAVTHRRLAFALEQKGDFAGALDHWQAAANLDPLNFAAHVQLLRALDFSGDKRARQRVAREFAQRISDPAIQWTFDAVGAAYDADWSRFLLSAIKAERLDPDNQYIHRNLMMLESVFGPKSARPYAGKEGSFTALILEGKTDEILGRMRNAPADFFRLDFETTDVAEFLARKGRLKDLVETYDAAQRSAHPLLDSELGPAADLLILGLRRQGRPKEAERILGVLERQLNATTGLRPAYRDSSRAVVEMLKGRTDVAAELLERSMRDDWALGLINTGRPVFEYFVFESISGHPKIMRARTKFTYEMNRERQEAIRGMEMQKLRPLRCRAIPHICPA